MRMPYFGLGVYLMNDGKEVQTAVQYALDIGYRLIDTASAYDNESGVGKAIRQSTVERSEIFVTTKLWNSDHGYDKARKAFEKSLKKLDLDYIDLYLIHWPVKNKRKETWRALETLLDDGLCRAIGVSNYMLPHLRELLDYAAILPAVNQVEFSPFLYQKDLLDFCNNHNIQLEAYSPLTRGKKFNNEVLVSIADKYKKTAAQILIRWALEHQVVVIPKSSNPDRIEENADVFDFSIEDQDMEKLDNLNEDFRVSWNPTSVV
ncbi:MAG: aldo/keto reductase [Calditrichaeota bacterium]|nr:aldo/keto reductase [Calditrichota bacterium]RQW03971.1 MAG: aldo/keto reductase [Calditrichota bacterium]